MRKIKITKPGWVVAIPLILAVVGTLVGCTMDSNTASARLKAKEGQKPPSFHVKRMILFTPSSASTAQWGVAPESISIGKDYVVRYVVIAKSQSGVVNAFYEGIRCSEAQYKVYARYSGGVWRETEAAAWQSLFDSTGSRNRHTLALARMAFCNGVAVPESKAAIVRKLRSGRH